MSTAAPVRKDDPNPNPDSEEEIGSWPYSFAIVPLKQLTIDAYQRPLTTFVDKIVAKFNPALVGTLCVSERSKTKFAVIDGQTRAEGMRRLAMTEAPCLVFHGLTRENEAQLFALFQTERRGMTSSSRFKAEVIAGNPHAVEINDVVEGLGFVIDQSIAASNAIAAVASLEFVYHSAKAGAKAKTNRNPELLSTVLQTIKEAWPRLPDTAKSSLVIRGLGYYFCNEGKSVDREKLVQRLSKVTPGALAKRAEHLRDGEGMTGNSPAYMSRAIEAQYRKQR